MSAHRPHMLRDALAAMATIGFVIYFAVTTPEWSAVRAIPLHFVWAYAMAIELIWLPILISVRGGQRSRDAQQDSGGAPAVHSPEAVDARVLQNTLEQTVFAAIATGLLALAQPHHAAMLLLAHALLFTIGRATFWFGYRRQPAARIYGFIVTFTSTLAIYIYTASFLLRAIILN